MTRYIYAMITTVAQCRLPKKGASLDGLRAVGRISATASRTASRMDAKGMDVGETISPGVVGTGVSETGGILSAIGKERCSIRESKTLVATEVLSTDSSEHVEGNCACVRALKRTQAHKRLPDLTPRTAQLTWVNIQLTLIE